MDSRRPHGPTTGRHAGCFARAPPEPTPRDFRARAVGVDRPGTTVVNPEWSARREGGEEGIDDGVGRQAIIYREHLSVSFGARRDSPAFAIYEKDPARTVACVRINFFFTAKRGRGRWESRLPVTYGV